MDAKEFIKQLRRMDKNAHRNYSVFDDSIEDVIAEVEKWAKENPAKTRQSKFLEQYPEAELGIDGVIEICPSRVSATYRRDTGPCAVGNCVGCRREFWGQEVE